MQKLYPVFFSWMAFGLLFPATNQAGPVAIEKIAFEGWESCYRLTNGEVELIAVADVGPRVIHFAFAGGDNVFNVDSRSLGQTGSTNFKIYGGHRLWAAPETRELTYYGDNDLCRVKQEENRLILTAPIEVMDEELRKTVPTFADVEEKALDPAFRPHLRFQKEMEISMNEDGQVTVIHRITNCSLKVYHVAPWALSVMDKGGFAIVPNTPFAPHGPGHYLPERSIQLWSYTRLTDPRLAYLEKYMTIQQDPAVREPLKIGFSSTPGWVAYALGENLFVKYLDYVEGAEYPDRGSSVEFYTGGNIMEIESLAPLRNLKPGETSEHREQWQLFKIQNAMKDEGSIDAMLSSIKLEIQ